MTETWFRIALADDAGVRAVVAPGAHLGAALDVARARAGRGAQGYPVAAEPADGGDVPLGQSVGKGAAVERGVLTGVPAFRWPSGVLPSVAGARSLVPAEGFVRERRGATELVEAVVAGERLVETFMRVVERLPAADNVEVRVTGALDGAGVAEVWVSPRLGDVRRAIRFLDDHDVDLLLSGHAAVSIYLRQQRATLRLTEHKTVVWLADDAATADLAAGWLAADGVPAIGTLARIANAEHHHWQPVGARRRARLLAQLQRARMRRVDSWPDPA